MLSDVPFFPVMACHCIQKDIYFTKLKTYYPPAFCESLSNDDGDAEGNDY